MARVTGCRWITLPICILSFCLFPRLVWSQAKFEFLNQNSPVSKRHSSIVTQDGGKVWDTQFAAMVEGALGQNYREVTFAFMECFGGGMIDELLAKNFAFASYTSATRHNQISWAGVDRKDPKIESYYNEAYSPHAGGQRAKSHMKAAEEGREHDRRGPFVRRPYLEDPQYTSSGVIGDNITLHRRNDADPQPQRDKYLAILFGGSTDEPGNKNSLRRIVSDLKERGYTNDEMYVMYAGGDISGVQVDDTTRARDMQDAWDWVKARTTPMTQVYYWNSWGHGAQGTNVLGQIRGALPLGPDSGTEYFFDVEADFILQMQDESAFYTRFGSASPLDFPFFEIDAASPRADLQVMLNGVPLTFYEIVDTFADGREYSHRFLMSISDLGALQTSGNRLVLNFTGASSDFGFGGIRTGVRSNGPAVAGAAQVPEPGAWTLLLAAGLPALFLRRGKPNRPS